MTRSFDLCTLLLNKGREIFFFIFSRYYIQMKFNKKQRKIGIGILIAVIILSIFVVSNKDIIPFALIGESAFTPIFCNDYEFTCCNEKEDVSNLKITLQKGEDYTCSPIATRCEIRLLSQTNPDNWFKINGVTYQDFSVHNLNPNDRVENTQQADLCFPSCHENTYEVDLFINRLDFCGRAGCTVGVPVLGADQCKFNPENDKIYTTTEQLINAVSWTVPEGQCVLSQQRGDRHICGYLEESCIDNSDCTGHTFGRFECVGRTLSEYGCVSFGIAQPLEQDRLPSDPEWGKSSQESLFGKRCEVINSRQVQCCGDTDCGTNFFCDTSTWTCKADVQCTQDVDCGVSQQCDYVSKKLKEPFCNFGTCDFREQTVECCNDNNCPSGFFCNAERKCEERLATCQTCPYECCENECELSGGFFDRPCPANKPFCVENVCKTEFEPSEECASCDKYAISRILGGVFKSQACKPKLHHTTITCLLSFLKFLSLIPIFIIATIFGTNFFRKSKSLGIKDKKVALLVSLTLALVLVITTFFLFTLGIILIIIYFAFLMILRFIS